MYIYIYIYVRIYIYIYGENRHEKVDTEWRAEKYMQKNNEK